MLLAAITEFPLASNHRDRQRQIGLKITFFWRVRDRPGYGRRRLHFHSRSRALNSPRRPRSPHAFIVVEILLGRRRIHKHHPGDRPNSGHRPRGGNRDRRGPREELGEALVVRILDPTEGFEMARFGKGAVKLPRSPPVPDAAAGSGIETRRRWSPCRPRSRRHRSGREAPQGVACISRPVGLLFLGE